MDIDEEGDLREKGKEGKLPGITVMPNFITVEINN
ncbi:uncharacterized protein G2W53_012553 [Senna tora]|uniref:Uncharacterized protein n=1 Tax=Senna tora TaxID=362788 RepID=A0A834TX43_9FABA|nr:uncharacterized protein G2W53_012553 [Senna tora]